MRRSMRHPLPFTTSRILFFVAFFISIILLGQEKAFATHAAGSDIKYRSLGGNQYEMEVTFYRDCDGVAEPSDITVNCKSVSGNCNFNVICTKVPTGNGIEITVPCTSTNTTCNGGTVTGIRKWIYKGTVSLPSQRADWVFSYSICCRNCAITTINNPCASNSVLYIEATLNNILAQGNSSPSFSNIPIAFVCIGQSINYNHGVIDVNGDSLKYELIAPKTSATTNVSFISPASISNPIASSTPFNLNSVTGDINFSPSQLQIGVMAIRVKEYRNGQLIGSVIRDMQIYTQTCGNNLPTLSGINGGSNYSATICPGQTYCFTVNSADLDASQNVTLTTNNGIPNASYNISSGNRPTLTFCWTPTFADISLSPKTFTVTVRDNACPSNGIQTYSFNIYVPSPYFNVATTNINCNGDSSGSATASPVYSGNFTYLWNNGSTSAALSNIVAGTYTVTTTDISGCSASQSVTITEPAGMNLTTIVMNPTCSNINNGLVDLSVSGGVAPYSYLWNNGATTQDISLLTAGTYTVTVTDINGCSKISSTTITSTSSLIASTYTTDVACFGQYTGSIILTTLGGTAPLYFVWNNGATTQNISNLTTGNYTVTITDANGCTATTTGSISQPTTELTCTLSKTDILCKGSATGNISSSVSGGTSPYTYLWNNGTTTSDLSGQVAGTYTLTVTDSHNCSTSSSIIINQTLSAISITTTAITDVKCYGDLTGNITNVITGGVAPYSYLWNSGETTASLNNIGAGTYTITATDANGCSKSSTITVNQPAAALVATANSTNINCSGNQTGMVEIIASGGTSPYNYHWNTGSTSSQINNLGSGTYTVIVTDQNGCQLTNTFTITQPTTPLSLSLTSTDVTCYNVSDATINSQVSGGTAPYNYSWNNGSNSSNLNGLNIGTYTLIVTDANGCTTSSSKYISQPQAALTEVITTTNVPCYNTNTGAISISTNGGTAPYSYNWSNGNISATNSALAAGMYTVTVTDANGCSITQSATLTEPSTALAVTETHQNLTCSTNGTGSISAVATGGTYPYTYVWSNGTNTPNNNFLPQGNYTLTVTDQNGCTATISTAISQLADALSSTGTTTNIKCYGDNNGAINVTTTAGTVPYTFSWSSGETTEDLSNLSAGDYTVTITDSVGCILTNQYHITQPVSALSATISPTNILCFDDSTGSLDLNVTGGTAPFYYTWSNGASTEDLTSLTAGLYQVNIIDANGCTTSSSTNITQPQAPLTLAAEIQNLACYNDNNGAISVTIAGGSAPYSYQWSNGAVNTTISGLAQGVYQLTVTDANGCQLTQTFNVLQPIALNVNPTTVAVFCKGNSTGSINLNPTGGTAPFNALWSSGASGNVLLNVPAGSYTYTLTDANLCSVAGTITITEPASTISLTSSNLQVNCFGGQTGAIDITANGGIAPYTYNWNNGAISEDINNLNAGNYTVIVTDANGCTLNTTYSIQQPVASISLQGSITNIACNAGNNGAISVTISGGTVPYTYSWNNGASTLNLQSLSAGNYSMLVTDANGCTSTTVYTVNEPAQALNASAVSTNVSCYAANTGSITLTTSGGTAPYTYNWNTGANTSSLNNIAAGIYAVTITDTNGCTYTTNAVVQQPSTAISVSYLVQDVACFGGNTGIIHTTSTGGTAPYSYNWNTGATTSDLSNLVAGNYILTVTDANGCVYTQNISVTQAIAAVSSTITNTNVNCHGSNSASIDLTVVGGLGSYTYQWSNGQTTQDLVNIGAGTYSVIIIDQNGCTNSNTITITQPATSLFIGATNTPVGCFGAQTGSISLQINGGTSPYSYVWNTGSTADNLNNIGAGNYTVTVTDANGCSATQSTTLIQPSSAITATTTATAANCIGSVLGTVSIAVTGGTSPYTYLWNSGATSQNITNANPGVYTVTITDVAGCSLVKSATVTDNTNSTIHTTGSPEICIGNTLTIYGDSIAGANYQWYYNGVALNGATSFTFTTPVAGVYTLSVTTSCGTHISNPIEVIVRSLNNITVNNDVIICGGESVQLNASGGMEYNWSPVTGLDHTNIPNPIATPVQTTAYSVTVKDQYGCTASATVNVTIMCDSINIPNGFSPNHDGTNDHFVIDGIESYPGNALFIYNRWGNLVYKQKDYDNKWEGTSNVNGVMYGQELPNGTYYFILNLNNDEKPINGFVVIRR